MAQVFISYAREDRDRVAALAHAMEDRGLSVWWDREIPPGSTFDEVVERELEASSVVVVVWTASSIGSRWVRTEAAEGLSREILVPVLLEPVRPPLAFRRVQCVDLADWSPRSDDGRLDEFVAAVEGFTGGPSSSPRRAVPPPDRPPGPDRSDGSRDLGDGPESTSGPSADRRSWPLPVRATVSAGVALLVAAWLYPVAEKRTPLMFARSEGLSPTFTGSGLPTTPTGTWLLGALVAAAVWVAVRLWRRPVEATTAGLTIGLGLSAVLLAGTWLVIPRTPATPARPLTVVACAALAVGAALCTRESVRSGLLRTARARWWDARTWGVAIVIAVSVTVYVVVPFRDLPSGGTLGFAVFAPWSFNSPPVERPLATAVALVVWVVVVTLLLRVGPPRVGGLAIACLFLSAAWLRAGEVLVRVVGSRSPFDDPASTATAVAVLQIGLWALVGVLGLVVRPDENARVSRSGRR